MNLFYLDDCPKTAAQLMINCHVSKMIVETGQILSNCYTLKELELAPKTQKGEHRKHSYPHHPCCKWVQESESNFMWAVEHGIYLYEEKLFRTGKSHIKLQKETSEFIPGSSYIFYFTKSNNFIFNADDILIESQRQKIKDRRANPKGKVPSDVWTVSRVCGTFKERVGWHNCQMPVEILERIILTSSNKGDIIVDPFSGSGTTAIACEKLGRNSINFDISEMYCTKSKERLLDYCGTQE